MAIEIKIEYDETAIFEEAVKPCRRGEWVYLICGSTRRYVELRKTLKDYLSFKRGLFTFKGILFLTIEKRNEVVNCVDRIIEIRKRDDKNKKIPL